MIGIMFAVIYLVCPGGRVTCPPNLNHSTFEFCVVKPASSAQ